MNVGKFVGSVGPKFRSFADILIISDKNLPPPSSYWPELILFDLKYSLSQLAKTSQEIIHFNRALPYYRKWYIIANDCVKSDRDGGYLIQWDSLVLKENVSI